LPAVLVRLAGAGTLEIEDQRGAGIDGRHIDRSGGFDEDFEALIAEALDQLERLRLCQRFAAGDLDEVAAVALHAVEDLVDRHPLAAGERVLGVAPAAAEIAAGEADEHAGAS